MSIEGFLVLLFFIKHSRGQNVREKNKPSNLLLYLSSNPWIYVFGAIMKLIGTLCLCNATFSSFSCVIPAPLCPGSSLRWALTWKWRYSSVKVPHGNCAAGRSKKESCGITCFFDFSVCFLATLSCPYQTESLKNPEFCPCGWQQCNSRKVLLKMTFLIKYYFFPAWDKIPVGCAWGWWVNI